MKPDLDPRILLGFAFGLLLLGFILPFLMVLQLLESTLFLNFLSFFSMILGSFLGFIGTASLVARRRRQ